MAKHPTGNTTRPTGIIEYGSDDESVIFQDPLTSMPSNGSEIGSGVELSSEGMNTNGTGAVTLDMSAFDYNSLRNSRQISFEIKSTAIGHPEDYNSYNNTGSYGVPPDVLNDYLLSWSTQGITGSTKAGRLFTSTNNLLGLQMEWGDTAITPVQPRLTNAGKGEYSLITIAGHGDRTELFIDHAPHYSFNNGGRLPVDLFKYLHVGTYENRSTTNYLTSKDRHIKNLVVSNRPVMLASHPVLRKPVVMSDSFGITFSESIGSPIHFDQKPAFQMKAVLAANGLRVGSPIITYPSSLINESVNGAVIDGTGTAAAEIGDQVAAVIAHRPSIVIMPGGGINDVRKSSGYDIAVFETKYKAILTSLLASSTGIEKVSISTIITHRGDAVYYDATRISRTAEVNAVINSLKAWADATFGAGRLIVSNAFNAIGGETSAADPRIIGRWNVNHPDYNNDIHPSAEGWRIVGRLIGQTIVDSL